MLQWMVGALPVAGSLLLAVQVTGGCGPNAPDVPLPDAADAAADGESGLGGSVSETVPVSGDTSGDDSGDGQTDGGDAADDGGASGARCGVNGRNDCGVLATCDPELGCVACAVDGDCPASAPVCIAGSCVSCTSSPPDGGASGCPTKTPACWPADHSCHAPCSDSSVCPESAPECDVASGQCWGCAVDTDCAGGVCSLTTRQCVQCAKNSDCDVSVSLPRCDVLHGLCVQCSSNADCGKVAPICDPSTRTCRVGCSSNAQCAAGSCDLATATCAGAATNADGGD